MDSACIRRVPSERIDAARLRIAISINVCLVVRPQFHRTQTGLEASIQSRGVIPRDGFGPWDPQHFQHTNKTLSRPECRHQNFCLFFLSQLDCRLPALTRFCRPDAMNISSSCAGQESSAGSAKSQCDEKKRRQILCPTFKPDEGLFVCVEMPAESHGRTSRVMTPGRDRSLQRRFESDGNCRRTTKQNVDAKCYSQTG